NSSCGIGRRMLSAISLTSTWAISKGYGAPQLTAQRRARRWRRNERSDKQEAPRSMSVYVDKEEMAYRRMRMCHMLADTPAELHAMADKIGVARRWYQRDASTPHYDICKSKRALAIAAGAVEVDRRGMVAVIKRIRESVLSAPDGGPWAADYKATA